MSNTTARPLTEDESSFLRHMMMWGSDGYPVQKAGRRWLWVECFGVTSAQTIYKTKREAVAAVERYIDMLIDRKAGRL